MPALFARVLGHLFTSEDGRKIMFFILAFVFSIAMFGFLLIGVLLSAIFTTPSIEAEDIQELYLPVIEELELDTRTLKDGSVYADDGIRLHPSMLIVIDAILLKQDFQNASESKVKDMAWRFIEKEIELEEVPDICTVRDHQGKPVLDEDGNIVTEDCSYEIEWTYFHERSIDEVLQGLANEGILSAEEVVDVLTVIDFTIGNTYEHDYMPSMQGVNGWVWPTPSSRITSPYGYRTYPKVEFHTGVDIGAVQSGVYGNPVWAMTEGVISTAGWVKGYGLAVYIDHLNGIQTRYTHLDWVDVFVGQKVKKGQEIGFMGNTGSSTGVHLHFEILVDGQSVDPLLYFDGVKLQ